MENKNEIIENENLNTNNTANNDSKKSKKKLIIIISSIVAGLAIIAAIVVVLVVMLNKNNLSPEEKFNNMISEINTNLKDSTNIKYSSTFKDGGVVAEIEREVMVSKNTENDTVNLTVSTTENKLGSSFILESSNYTTYYDGVLPDNLFNYKFDYQAFSEVEVSDTTISGVVKNSEVSNVLNTTVNNSSDLDEMVELQVSHSHTLQQIIKMLL